MNKVLWGLTLLISFTCLADEISLRADLWCPYTCDPQAKNPGFMIEIAKEILFED